MIESFVLINQDGAEMWMVCEDMGPGHDDVVHVARAYTHSTDLGCRLEE